jgi:hypothetical protein
MPAVVCGASCPGGPAMLAEHASWTTQLLNEAHMTAVAACSSAAELLSNQQSTSTLNECMRLPPAVCEEQDAALPLVHQHAFTKAGCRSLRHSQAPSSKERIEASTPALLCQSVASQDTATASTLKAHHLAVAYVTTCPKSRALQSRTS